MSVKVVRDATTVPSLTFDADGGGDAGYQGGAAAFAYAAFHRRVAV